MLTNSKPPSSNPLFIQPCKSYWACFYLSYDQPFSPLVFPCTVVQSKTTTNPFRNVMISLVDILHNHVGHLSKR